MNVIHLLFKLPFVFYSRVLCLAILLSAGCNSKNTTKSEKPEFSATDDTAVRDEVLKTLRTSEITKQLRASGEVFHQEAIHDLSQTNHYLLLSNKAAAAANLGIYMSDLGYLVEFKNIDAGPYFDACLILAEYAGVKKQFSNAIELRFGEIISGNEAIEKSLTQTFKNADNASQGEDFKKLHAAALTGYYFEELYHLVSIVKLYENKNLTDTTAQIVRSSLHLLLNQKQEINNLVRYYDHIKLQPKGIILYQDFLKMQAKYQSLDSDRLLNESNLSVALQDKTVRDIFDFIISIRDGITNF